LKEEKYNENGRHATRFTGNQYMMKNTRINKRMLSSTQKKWLTGNDVEITPHSAP